MKTLDDLNGATVEWVINGKEKILIIAGVKVFVEKIEPVENTTLQVRNIQHAFNAKGVQ